jgi:hypothetical protein
LTFFGVQSAVVGSIHLSTFCSPDDPASLSLRRYLESSRAVFLRLKPPRAVDTQDGEGNAINNNNKADNDDDDDDDDMPSVTHVIEVGCLLSRRFSHNRIGN